MPPQYSYTSNPPTSRTACTESQCLYSTAIPLLLLLAIRPVQSLSACTVQLYLYTPYGPYGLCRASVPVQYSYTSTPPMGPSACTKPQCLYSRAIPLLPLWTVQSVQSLSACTFSLYRLFADPGPRAVQDVDLRPPAYWDCGFESRMVEWVSLSCECRCFVKLSSVRRDDHSSRGVLPSVCVCVCVWCAVCVVCVCVCVCGVRCVWCVCVSVVCVVCVCVVCVCVCGVCVVCAISKPQK